MPPLLLTTLNCQPDLFVQLSSTVQMVVTGSTDDAVRTCTGFTGFCTQFVLQAGQAVTGGRADHTDGLLTGWCGLNFCRGQSRE